MEKTTKYLSSGLMILVMLLGILFFFMILSGGTADEYGIVKPNISAINMGLYLAYFAMGLCFLMAAAFGLVNSLMNPKKSMGSIIGIVFAVVVYLIAKSMASEEVLPIWSLRDKAGVMFNAWSVKAADTGLYVVYVFGFISIMAILFGEAFTIFKKYIAK